MKPVLPLTPLFVGLASCSAVVRQSLLSENWALVEDVVDLDQNVQYSFGLARGQIDSLRSKIGGGQPHLSQVEIQAMRAPESGDVDSVTRWLEENGIKQYTVNDEWVNVNSTVAEANSLLTTTLQYFAYGDQPPVLRCANYSIPDGLKSKIKLMQPFSNFLETRYKVLQNEPLSRDDFSIQSTSAPEAQPCQTEVTPECLKKLYKIDYDIGGRSAARLGIAGFLEQYPGYVDIQDFLELYAPDFAGRNFTVESVNGGENDQGNPGVEANLDMEYAMGLAAPANITYYSTGGRGVLLGPDGKPVNGSADTNEPYLDLLNYLLDKPDSELPHVLSISYGDDEQSVPADYAEYVCEAFGLLTARGVSILGSSGDNGAIGSPDSGCMANDGSNRQTTIPTFPSTCEWITSVGGTMNGKEPPMAVEFSGGGFSWRYPRPPWQNGPGLVDDYIEKLQGHLQGKYNENGRAFPDIAAVSTNFSVILAGQRHHVGGTSASAPTVAAMLTLVTDARLRRGLPPLGWLNELLYSKQVRSVLQDITEGATQSCVWDGVAPGGWLALPGWDATTGNGVPNNFGKLLHVLENAYTY